MWTRCTGGGGEQGQVDRGAVGQTLREAILFVGSRRDTKAGRVWVQWSMSGNCLESFAAARAFSSNRRNRFVWHAISLWELAGS